MSEPKTRPTDDSVIEFLDRVADENRRRECHAVLEMMRRATGVEPVMWGKSIVGFGCYRYRYASGRQGEWPVIGFAPRKNDLTLYLMSGFNEHQDLMRKLGAHRTGKSCLYIRRVADVDEAVLMDLIARAVEAMSDRRVDR